MKKKTHTTLTTDKRSTTAERELRKAGLSARLSVNLVLLFLLVVGCFIGVGTSPAHASTKQWPWLAGRKWLTHTGRQSPSQLAQSASSYFGVFDAHWLGSQSVGHTPQATMQCITPARHINALRDAVFRCLPAGLLLAEAVLANHLRLL